MITELSPSHRSLQTLINKYKPKACSTLSAASTRKERMAKLFGVVLPEFTLVEPVVLKRRSIT